MLDVTILHDGLYCQVNQMSKVSFSVPMANQSNRRHFVFVERIIF